MQSSTTSAPVTSDAALSTVANSSTARMRQPGLMATRRSAIASTFAFP